MKVYVDGYKPKKKVIEGKQFDSYPEHEVFYSKEPRWTMDRDTAESEFKIMNNLFRFHVGTHYCNFTVEALADGQFAIVCLSHPDA